MSILKLILPNGRAAKQHHPLCECVNGCAPEKRVMKKAGHFIPDEEWYEKTQEMAYEELIAGLY